MLPQDVREWEQDMREIAADLLCLADSCTPCHVLRVHLVSWRAKASNIDLPSLLQPLGASLQALHLDELPVVGGFCFRISLCHCLYFADTCNIYFRGRCPDTLRCASCVKDSERCEGSETYAISSFNIISPVVP